MTSATTTSSSHILYSFRRCPYAMRARMALLYSQQTVEIREIVLRDKPASMIEISPKGTVPVLILKKGKLLEESLDIMYWALAQNDPDDWQLSTTDLNANILELIKECDGEFKMNLDQYKYADRYPEKSAITYREQGERFLNLLNRRLATHTFLFGQKISIADIAIFPFIRQFAHVDKAWFDQSEYEHLKKWLKSHLESELFLSIMLKLPAWKEGDPPTLFP